MSKLIDDFLYEATNLKDYTKQYYRRILANFTEFLGNKNSFSKKHVLMYLNSDSFRALKNSSQNTYKMVIKRFLQYLDKSHDFIKLKKLPKTKINPEALPTTDEINIILNNMTRAMDKCLLMILLEGLRNFEAINVRIGDITDKGTHMIIYVQESKSSKRPVPVVKSVPYIIDWLNQHPQKDNPDAYLFVRRYGKKLGPYSRQGIIAIIKRNNSIPKNLHPHIFRHTSATMDLRAKIPPKQVMHKFGWTSWKMIERYSHLTTEDVENAVLEAHHIKPTERNPINGFIQNKECYVCRKKNPGTNIFCSQCGRALDIKNIQELEKEKKTLQEKYTKKELIKLFSRWLDKQE